MVQPPRGGMPKIVEMLAREQMKSHEVGVVCRPGPAVPMAETGARVWALPMVREISPVQDARDLGRLIRIVRAFRPDVIHAHASKAGALGRLAGGACGVPVVFSPQVFAHRIQSLRAKTIYLLLERALAPLTDQLHVGYEEERREAIRDGLAGPDRVTVIPNGIDPGPLVSLPDPAGDPPTVGTFARLWPQKRIDLMLSALAEVSARGLDFRVAVIGDGPLRGELERLAGELGLSERTRFIADGRGPADALAELDVYVLSSSEESFPLVPIEAMAAGRAVVATSVGAVTEIVEDGVTGLVVQPDDSGALADAIADLLSEPELRQRLGSAGRVSAASRFPIAAMAGPLDAVYEAASQ